MRIVVAPDKFKGSLSAREAAAAIARGLRRQFGGADMVEIPIADGGEGTMALIAEGLGAEMVEARVSGPLGQAVTAGYALAGDRAVLEMSSASGLQLVPPAQRDPWAATTYGTGELIGEAIDRGAREVIVGIGGSATNDGGRGMAAALGFEFHADPAGGGLHIVPPDVLPAGRARFTAACDVSNPLLGADGCTRVYGPQKGIRLEEFGRHEERLARLVEAVARDVAAISPDTPGAGAAGGLGFGLMAFCGAELRPGFDLVAELTGLAGAVAAADLVVTGEGSMDRQTLMGKGPAGVAGIARAAGKKVIAFCGVARDRDALGGSFDAVISLEELALSTADSMARAGELLEEVAAGAKI